MAIHPGDRFILAYALRCSGVERIIVGLANIAAQQWQQDHAGGRLPAT